MFRKMSKVVWLSLPLLVASACSTMQRGETATEDQNAFTSLPAGASQAQTGVYPTSPNGPLAYSRPPGAPAADWKVAEEIRSTLMENRKMGRTPFTATVNNGTVTLRGYARTEGEKQQLEQMVAQMPGVQRVDNQLQIGNRVVAGGSNLTE